MKNKPRKVELLCVKASFEDYRLEDLSGPYVICGEFVKRFETPLPSRVLVLLSSSRFVGSKKVKIQKVVACLNLTPVWVDTIGPRPRCRNMHRRMGQAVREVLNGETKGTVWIKVEAVDSGKAGTK